MHGSTMAAEVLSIGRQRSTKRKSMWELAISSKQGADSLEASSTRFPYGA